MSSSRKGMEKMELANHRILSCVYNFFLFHADTTGYKIKSIEVTDSRAYLVTAISESSDADILKVLRIMVARDSSTIDQEDMKKSFITEGIEDSYRNTITERILAVSEYDEESHNTTLESLVHLSVWLVDCNNGTIRMKKGRTIDRNLEEALKHDPPNTFFNFPVPYVDGMDPVITLSFLTLNFTVRGWQSSIAVLNDAYRYARYYSHFANPDVMLEAMTATLKACIKTGLFTEKGDKIFLPRSRTRSESAFIRKYRQYLARTMKRTLYDFGSSLQ